MSLKKRVLIFSPFNFPPNFLGLNFEFLQNEINDGHEVFYMTCDKTFKSCGFNTYGLRYMCEICVHRFHGNRKIIEGKFNAISIRHILSDADKIYADRAMAPIAKVEKGLVIDTFEVGESVYSSYISKTKEKEFSDVRDENVLKTLAYQSLIIFNALIRFLSENSIDKVILFNGRWDYYRAALSAARIANAEIVVLENLREGGYYEVFKNALPHNISVKNDLITQHWDAESNLDLKKQIARDFFLKKRQGIALFDKSYTAHQKQGFLPDYIDPGKKTIAVYNSSDFEFEAVGKEYANPFFKDQSSCIAYLAKLISNYSDFQMVVRVHPNLKGLQSDFLDQIYKLKGVYPNVFVIFPEEEVDSYALMDHAFKVVTFVSTMGIEASYWEKPVVLLGKSIYYYSDVAYVPGSYEEIPGLLLKPLPPKPKVNSEKYAYYFLTGGLKARYFNWDKEGAYFVKKRIDKLSGIFKIYYKVLKALHIKN